MGRRETVSIDIWCTHLRDEIDERWQHKLEWMRRHIVALEVTIIEAQVDPRVLKSHVDEWLNCPGYAVEPLLFGPKLTSLLVGDCSCLLDFIVTAPDGRVIDISAINEGSARHKATIEFLAQRTVDESTDAWSRAYLELKGSLTVREGRNHPASVPGRPA